MHGKLLGELASVRVSTPGSDLLLELKEGARLVSSDNEVVQFGSRQTCLFLRPGIERTGLTPHQLSEDLNRAEFRRVTLDCAMVGSKIYVFEIIEC